MKPATTGALFETIATRDWHYRCRLCGRQIKSHPTGARISHGRAHARRGEAYEGIAFGGHTFFAIGKRPQVAR
jgi:hypothetical protein